MDPSSDTSDYIHSSSVSEVDSLSDSDWLEIASNRVSDDNDSLSSRDSDREEVDGLLPSRRSSISVGSSRDGEIEAWEGFASDSADDGVPDEPHLPPILLPAAHDAEPADDAEHASPTERDVAEEQRVKDALDQSMISTLSSSRSSSLGGHPSTVHSSLRDLRLSFPDPLTSSRDELNRSYEDVSPSEASSVTDADDVVQPSPTADVPPSPAAVDPGSFTTPEVPLVEEISSDVPHTTFDFDIVLYGSSAIKWSFVDNIVKKATIGGGMALMQTKSIEPMRLLHIQGNDKSSPTVVAVTDRTDGEKDQVKYLSAINSSCRPSLAVVYLPSLPLSLPDHTFYLPVYVSPPRLIDSVDHNTTDCKTAQDMWTMLAVPNHKTLRLKPGGGSPVFDSEDLDELQSSDVYHAFQQLAVHTEEKKQAKGLGDRFTSIQAMTLLVFISLVLGFTVNSAFHSSTPPPTPTLSTPSSNSLWGIFGPIPNHSTIASPSVTNSNVAIVPSSLKDFALAVFNPATMSPRPAFVESVSGSTQSPDCGCSMSWSEKVKSCKDVILRPLPSTFSIDGTSKAFSRTSSSKAKQKASSTSLGLNVVDSLSEIFDVEALVKAVQRDLKELLDALDELMRVIGRHTNDVVQQSKGTVQIIREGLQYRNDRARGKAKEWKEMGSQLMALAGEQMKGRASKARAQARALKNVALARSQQAYAVVGKSGQQLTEKSRGRKRRRLMRECKQHKEHRKSRTGRLFAS